jgi:AAA+ superfamily predicted ATPase
LSGAEEFKNLTEELIAIAPQIKKYRTYNSFLFQNYLFAINDGCGLTTTLHLFADLVETLGLFSFGSSKYKVREVKLELPGGRNSDSYTPDKEIRLLKSSDAGNQMICYDISAWMSETQRPEFREFLQQLSELEDRYIFIFRIPFIEPDIMQKLHDMLEDVLFMRSVSFVPLSNREFHSWAVNYLKETAYTMDDDAWDVFAARINEEKNDGRFYGFGTIEKLINEMIYRKQVSNSRSISAEDTDIHKEDILSLSQTYSGENIPGEVMLDRLIGMADVKKQIREIVAQIEIMKKSGEKEQPCIHMCFVGNPGTGKTTVARILGKIMKEKGLLRVGAFLEHGGRDFCGEYVGQTTPRTVQMCRDAYGSVLFIDEAYTLFNGDSSSHDYGKEALATLIAEMENHRTDMVVIMAGYTDEMKVMLQGNQGLRSRMPYTITFPNYSKEELWQIFMMMAERKNECDPNLSDEVKGYFSRMPDEVLQSEDFSNARYVRNLYERTKGKAVIRASLNGEKKAVITSEDFENAAAEKDIAELNRTETKKIGF